MTDFAEYGLTDEALTRLLFVRHDPEPADLALVFGHADPARAARRARRAAGLYCSGLVPRLLLTGGPPHASEAQHMAQVVTAQGVPPDGLLLEHRARNTIENVRNARALLEAHGFLDDLNTVLLVSCPWHMKRVLFVAERGLPTGIRLRCCPHEEAESATSWPHSPEGRRLVAEELRLLGPLARARPGGGR
jgi:uncharacterized SAM-binding protein YcdF (DUF218 family)